MVEGNRIAFVGKEFSGEADKTIDARGKLVSPGFIDTHVHAGQRIAARGSDAVWIHVRPHDEAIEIANKLELHVPSQHPLFGIPFAVKDNIDVAGMPTTAACPEYSYVPKVSASAVERLERAGAICIGKTNLDQFATGLSGVRSPYGICRCVFDDRYIAGGSSSGSAVAVAAGLVTLALGTDTGGSGRIPAGFNNVVGLKPTRGLIPTTGVIPNCRTLDCVSVFALTCWDAMAAFEQMRGSDDVSPFMRSNAHGPLPALNGRQVRFGIPMAKQRCFFDDVLAQQQHESALSRLGDIGELCEIDFSPFQEAGELMFNGPWIAERLQAIGSFITSNPNALLPVTRDIILGADRFSATDAFGAYYRLREIKLKVEATFETIDVLVVPTAARFPTLVELEAEPITANARLGYYSYFVNLLDLAASAIPNGFTLIGPPLSDRVLNEIASQHHRRIGGQLGATGHQLPGGTDRASSLS